MGLFFALLGCSSGGRAKLVRVTGKVTVDGQPLSEGLVTFVPQALEGKSDASMFNGVIEGDGSYRVLSDGKDRGIPVGKYKVTVTVIPRQGPASLEELKEFKSKKKPAAAPFAPKFGNIGTTPLSVEVVENPQPGAYDIKLTK